MDKITFNQNTRRHYFRDGYCSYGKVSCLGMKNYQKILTILVPVCHNVFSCNLEQNVIFHCLKFLQDRVFMLPLRVLYRHIVVKLT